MRHLKVTLSYDGTDFLGWQKQASGRTIQGVLEEKIQRMHQTEIQIQASGRTDTGVHAHGQVISFWSHLDSIPLYKFGRAMNGFLPRDISVQRVELVVDDFHPRYDARKRVYKYYIDCRALPSAIEDRYAWRIGWFPNLRRLNAFAAGIIGTHDFSTFSAANDQVPNRVRTVYSSSFHMEGHYLVYEISGASFLWRMVRSITGSILQYERQGIRPEAIREFLKAGSREFAGPTAPARGLFLHRVEFKQDFAGSWGL